VAPDGKSVLLEEFSNLAVATLPPAKGEEPRSLGVGGTLGDGHFSPDGRWIAYVDTSSVRPEIFVIPASGGEGKWQISNGGGMRPRWSRSGNEIFYLAGENLMAVPIRAEPRFEPGVPRALFSKPDLQFFDVEPDGEHFVLVETPEPTTRTSLGVVVNWFSRISPKVGQAPPR
jgi:hypothetical protein